MSMRQLTDEEKLRGANGDLLQWMEYEGDVNRDTAEYRGRGDPDPKYDLAPLLSEQTFADMVFIRQWEQFFNDYEKNKTID